VNAKTSAYFSQGQEMNYYLAQALKPAQYNRTKQFSWPVYNDKRLLQGALKYL
jgi:hypothetical protein